MPGEKGSYRSVYSSIWDDPDFQALGHIAQLVFLALRTGPECNFPCIFTFYPSTLYERLGTLSPAEIDGALDKLTDQGWIRYDRPILWIIKGLKREPNYYPSNRTQAVGIRNIIKTLPKLNITTEFLTYYDLTPPETGPGGPIPGGIPGGQEGAGVGADRPHGWQGSGSGSGSGTGKEERSSETAGATAGAPTGPAVAPDVKPVSRKDACTTIGCSKIATVRVEGKWKCSLCARDLEEQAAQVLGGILRGASKTTTG